MATLPRPRITFCLAVSARLKGGTVGRLPNAILQPKETNMSTLKRQDDSESPGIVDAVIDQDRTKWIKYGFKGGASEWFSLPELMTAEKDVFARLTTVGGVYLTTTTKNAFKKSIEDRKAYRTGIVAAAPGFIDDHTFVYGDGRVYSAPGTSEEVIVTFKPLEKFEPRGSLEQWQSKLAPVVRDQPIPITVICAALSGCLLRFTPNFGNPIVELTGLPNIGKTTVAMAAASVWAGDPNSSIGGAELWNLTAFVLDHFKLAHRDMALVLDEQNLAAATPQDLAKFLPQAVSSLEKTGERLRMGHMVSAHSHLSVISTGNVRLQELVADNDWGRAVLSRTVAIAVPESGILSHVPEGSENSPDPYGEAIVSMTDTVNEDYGVAGRAFVEGLIKGNGLAMLPYLLDMFEIRLRKVAPICPPRTLKTFTLFQTTAFLARLSGVIPASWGNLFVAIEHVFREVALPPDVFSAHKSAADKVLSYYNAHAMIDVEDMTEAVDEQEFQGQAGFLRKRGSETELMIPSQRFQEEFPEYINMVRILREAKVARTEGGNAPKLTIKCPPDLCSSGRVYCFNLNSLMAAAGKPHQPSPQNVSR
jgi:hypothetical protein